MQEDGQMSDLPQEPLQSHKGTLENHNAAVETPKSPVPPQAMSSSQPVQDDSVVEQVEEPDPKEPLEPFDWDALEERYHAKMQECQKAEEGIYADFATWVKVFETWASVTTSYENERSHKRLKTRTSFVKSAEERLEEKRKHYMKVVKAFESALALLGE